MVVGGSHRKNQIELAKYLKSIKLSNGRPKFDLTALTLTDRQDEIKAEFESFEGGINIVTLDHEEGTLIEEMQQKTTSAELFDIFKVLVRMEE